MEMSPYRLIITFDELAGREGASQRYFSQRIAPFFNDLEQLYVGEVWWILWGDRPQFLGGIVVESVEALRELLTSERWQDTLSEFKEMVTNLEVKLVREIV